MVKDFKIVVKNFFGFGEKKNTSETVSDGSSSSSPAPKSKELKPCPEDVHRSFYWKEEDVLPFSFSEQVQKNKPKNQMLEEEVGNDGEGTSSRPTFAFYWHQEDEFRWNGRLDYSPDNVGQAVKQEKPWEKPWTNEQEKELQKAEAKARQECQSEHRRVAILKEQMLYNRWW